ncbi:site-specific recombinase [Ottowia thiooxydans]|uniref:site-specific recombinase n=1 Tax=Ottowia thiooxydans TaxID=219182 RepID=UPI00040D5022|nr:site-specific recombinase [Ottowia thiooxydans]
MASSQLELIQILRALDPEAPLPKRHLWLIELLDWVRGESEDPQAAVARVRSMLDAAEVRPEWLKLWHRWWTKFLSSTDATPLLADLGFAPRAAFVSELINRLRRKVLPATPETTDLGELFDLLLPSEFDARWLRALDADTLRRLRSLLFRADSEGQTTGADYAQRVLLDALTYSLGQINAIGLSPDIRTRMSPEAMQARAFHSLPTTFERVRMAVIEHGRESAPSLVAIAQLREQLDACRNAAFSVYAHLQEHGISVHIEFQLRQLRQRIIRVKALLLCLETDAPALATAQLLSHLVRVNRDSRSLRSLMRTSTELLAAKVTERNAETGEHYITRTAGDYVRMLRNAAGGGFVLAFTTWFKLLIVSLSLSAFWGGLMAGANYALSFVIIMLLHWTVATKQPAMTAPAMAAKLKNMDAPGAVDNFVSEVVYLLRSQFAAIMGNVGMVIPMAMLITLGMHHMGWDGVLDIKHSQQILTDHHMLGPTVLFAAATGLLLFASSVIAGWVENWFVFSRLDSVIAYHPRSTRALGAERAERWGRYWRTNISSYTANISLGLLLGLVPPILHFFGIGFEVRHVTLVSGQVAAAGVELGAGILHQSAFWWAVGGMVITGLMNLASSFYFAFRLAMTAHNITGLNRRRLYRALIQRMLREPLSFLLPVRVKHTVTPPEEIPVEQDRGERVSM